MNTGQNRPASLLARIASLEGVLAAFGLFSLGAGLYRGDLMPVFWGITILAGLVILAAVRRRDWKKHWEEIGPQPSSPPAPEDPDPPSA